jgi:hypothetical protein
VSYAKCAEHGEQHSPCPLCVLAVADDAQRAALLLAAAAEKVIYRPAVDDSRQVDRDLRALREALADFRRAYSSGPSSNQE